MLEVKLFDELRQGQLPRFLLMVVKLTQLCQVHSQFPRHLHLSVRQVVPFPSVDPRLHFRVGLN
jgi:hypothetical protein